MAKFENQPIFLGGNRLSVMTNPYDPGSIYYDLWENNPYKDLYYEPSFWDKIGLSNKAKDANANYEQMFNEYIANIAQQKAENDYNSPENQASLERQAGLNPDITGISGVGEMSGQPYQGTPPSALNGVSPAETGINLITSVLGFATDTFSKISSIKNLSYQNESIESSLFSSIQPQAREFIINSFAKRLSGKDIGTNEDLKNEFANTYSTPTARRRARFAFENILKSTDFTAATHAYDSLNANDKAMHDYIGEVMKLTSILNQKKLNSDIKYYNNYDSSITANAKNAEEAIAIWRKGFYQRMYDDFKNGSDLAGLILIGATDRLSVLGLAGINNGKKSWFNSGITWNDSFIGGVGKKLGLW